MPARSAGAWLDRGELDEILDRERRAAAGVRDDDEDFFQEMSGSRSREREHLEHRHDPREQKRRRRSFLEELFDD